MEMKMENLKEEKKFSMIKIIGPLFGYYLIGILSQLIYTLYKLPIIITTFVQSDEELIGIFGQEILEAKGLEICELFFLNLTEELYIEFLYESAYYLINNIGVITVLTGVMAIPFLALLMKRDNKVMVSDVEKIERYSKVTYIYILIGGIALCIGLNCFMALSGLMELSESYEETSQALYNMKFLLQLVGLGMIIPLVEEMLYRGVIYRRLKRGVSAKFGIIVSAGIFGMVHGNSVQIIYGLICGLIFAWLYESYGSFVAPVMAHVVMNLTSVVGSHLELFGKLFSNNNYISIVAVIGCTITAWCYVMITNGKINKEN